MYLLDSIGELASAYREAALAFVGGSLVPHGGQNPIEPWAAGTTAVAGPHMQNFRDAAAVGEARGVLARVEDGAALARRLARAFAQPEELRRLGREAARLVGENRGAAERTASALAPLLARPARGAAS